MSSIPHRAWPLCLALSALLACAGALASPSATLDAVRARGVLACGVSTSATGFAVRDAAGQWSGFDIDFCRAMAAAVLGDPAKAKIVPVTAAQRFEMLARGEVDVLWRNTTVTFQRDTDLGVMFPAIMYYDGQGFMVRRSLRLDSLARFKGVRLCLQKGTTGEKNAIGYFAARNIPIVPVRIDEDLATPLLQGQCDAVTSDSWDLAGTRAHLPVPADFVILPELISKEPLGPVVRRGDDGWFLIVRWTVHALVSAEELGITQANAARLRPPPEQELARTLLGLEGDIGKPLGLDRLWARHAVEAAGNYGELFDRHLGARSALRLERGLNRLWNDGGLIYSPPLR